MTVAVACLTVAVGAGAVGCSSSDGPAGAGPSGGTDTGSDASTDVRIRDPDAGERDVASDGVDDTSSPGDAAGDIGSDSGDTTATGPAVWRLPPGADSWSRLKMTRRRATGAPDGRVVAAFDIEHSNNAYVLTDSSVHLLHLQPLEWAGRRPLSAIAGELTNQSLRAAYSDPKTSPDDRVRIVATSGSGPVLWKGEYTFDARKFEAFDSPEELSFGSSKAPDPPALRAAWFDRENDRSWLDGEPPCGNRFQDEFRGYVGYLTDSHLHLRDAVICKDYFEAAKLGESVLPQKGRPSVGKIGAAFWHGRALYLVAGESTSVTGQ